MQHFKFVKDRMANLGLYRPHWIDESSFLKYKYPFILFLFGMIMSLLGIPLLSSKSVAEFATGYMGFSVAAVMFYASSMLMWQTPNIHRLIDNFAKIIRIRSERIDLKITYEKMTHKIENYINFTRMFMFGSCVCPMLLLFPYILFIHFTRGLETADYRLPAPVWLPIDWKASLLGYSVAFVLNLVFGIILERVGCFILTLMIESFLVLSELIKDIKREIATLDENWKTNRNQVELMEKMCEIMWFNARINECIQELTEVYNLIFFCNFVWSLASICNSFMLFQITLTKDSIDMGVIGISIVAAIFAFGVVFIFCELGEQLSTQSEDINDAICELEWDTFPLRVQRMMPIILLTTQHPINLTAYAGIACARETFKKVVNTGYSYFTVFRG